MQAELDLTISPDTRKEAACKPDIAYGKFNVLYRVPLNKVLWIYDPLESNNFL